MGETVDVVVAGGGNAGFSAALAAAEGGARVLLLEKAPEEWAGGNTYFTAGAYRLTYDGIDDLAPLLDEPVEEEVELAPYSPADFRRDLERVTEGRCDPELTEVVTGEAAATVRWLHEQGLRLRLLTERSAFRLGGKLRFHGNMPIGVVGAGKGLAAQLLEAAERAGVEVRYSSPVLRLLPDGVVCPDGEVRSRAVVLACGGFEADPRLRAQYLGPRWDLARVRGTPFNTGDGIQMALDSGAQPYGHWSGCHACAWDPAAPLVGERERANAFTRGSYPLGIVVNAEGRRFLDEGADERPYTYARYGAEILRQPGAVAYQLFDATTAPLLRPDEYTMAGISRVEAPTVHELAEALGIDPEALERTADEFNAAVQPGSFDPSVKDGKRTSGIEPPKSNWAVPLETPPFLAFAVTCGITFTFGGLRVDGSARVLDGAGRPIPGLYAAGEIVGGLFWHNYAGGSGLTAGAVLGRRAGAAAAE